MPDPDPASSRRASASREANCLQEANESLTAQTRGGWIPAQGRDDDGEDCASTPNEKRRGSPGVFPILSSREA